MCIHMNFFKFQLQIVEQKWEADGEKDVQNFILIIIF